MTSSASSKPVAGKKEKTATEPGGGARQPAKRWRRSSSFACQVCGKRFPSQQAMAGHCSAHTRTAAARRIKAARQLLPPPTQPYSSASPSPPLPVVAVTLQLAVLFCPLTPVQLSLPLPPSQIGCRWPPGSLFPKSSLLSPSPTTGEPASATVDVTLRLGSGGKRGNEKPLVESPMVPNLHGHRGEQGRDGKRAREMDGCDQGRKKGERPDGRLGSGAASSPLVKCLLQISSQGRN